MNFNSPEYLIFLPVVLLVTAMLARHERSRNVWLLAASYAFYMSWNYRYAGLILFSTLVDYLIAKRLGRTDVPAQRRSLLLVSLVVNLGMLAVFKYFNFFIDSAVSILHFTGISADAERHHLTLLLPVGISFYTFQSLSYTIDVFRKQIPVEDSFVKFALFVSFFPQLVAGPIVRAADFLPQLKVWKLATASESSSGVALIFRGLIKKILIADLLAGFGVDAVFANPSAYSSLTLLLAVYGYSFQIYNDFSGYSDVAIGSARLLGFRLPANFNRPYRAQNVREFWTRWHISLSTWLKDYLYIPLGGGRRTPGRVRVNLMATMLLGGLWHGAALNFVLWGGWHGILLMSARDAERQPTAVASWRRALNIFTTFHLVAFSWLLFRIQDIETLGDYLGGFFKGGGVLGLRTAFILVLFFATIVHFSPPSIIERATARFVKSPPVFQGAVYAILVLVFVAFSFGTPAFIYFQF